MWQLAAWVLAVAVHAEETSCSAKGGKDGACSAASTGANQTCAERGFDTLRLSCNTCRKLSDRLHESGNSGNELLDECLGCCREAGAVERFSRARLLADANIQDRDQDLHDFIKRKAPLFPGLEVEYVENAEAAVELESDDDPDRIVRAVVTGWKSDHLVKFLDGRLEQKSEKDDDDTQGAVPMGVGGHYTAEVQTCSG